MMSAGEGNGSATGASRVGAELRAARMRLGWSLEDMARGLRIREAFLAAIEEGRIGDLPGSAYAVGFVRTYATSLGLDPDEVSRRFRAETQEVNRKTELSFPAPVPDRGVPAGAVVLLGLIVAIGAYAAWYKFSPRHDDLGTSPVPERLAALAPPSQGVLGTGSNSAASHVSPQIASILPPITPPTASPAPALAAPVMTAPVAAVPVPVPVPVTLTPQPMSPPASPMAAVVPDTSRVVLRFKADAYIQVREKQGPVLLNRVMKAGDVWPVPKEPRLVMTTGNAGGTDIVVDGINAASLGGNGVVRRDVSLEPESIKLPPGVRLPPQPRPQ